MVGIDRVKMLIREGQLNELRSLLDKQEEEFTDTSLQMILRRVRSLRELAIKKLFQGTTTNKDLRFAIKFVPSMAEEAWQRLLEQKPSDDDLRHVVRWSSSEAIANKAAHLIVNRKKSSVASLKAVIKHNEMFRFKAAKRFLYLRKTENSYFCLIIKRVPELRVEAGKRLLLQQPTESDLQCLRKHVPDILESTAQEAGR